MAISYDQCAPYLAATLLRPRQAQLPAAAAVHAAIVERLKESQGKDTAVRRRFFKVDALVTHPNLDIAWAHYSEMRPPPWYVGDELEEEHHHVFFVVCGAGIVTLTFSDPALRAAVVADVRASRRAPLDQLRFLTAKQINDAFVGSRVRTLWLSGTHRRVSTKADSKILTGIELEAALNPLEDQSYYFSSVRSMVENPAFSTPLGARPIVGANPRHARVWLGPCKDWSSFIGRIEVLIQAAAAAIQTPSAKGAPLPVLAQALEGMGSARAPYDMAVIVPEAVSAGSEKEQEEAWLHEFSDAAHFEVTADAASPSFEAKVFWGRQCYGTIKYDFADGRDAAPTVKTTVLDWDKNAEHEERVRKICENTDFLTVYYDTGHTFSRGLVYETRFRDARFLDWSWVKLNGFDVDTEKPLNGKKLRIDAIGTPGDTSLFGFVAKHWPLAGTHGRGWLACDDGSMESADFIHFDERADPPQLTLIHVKGSGSEKVTRSLSVADYEVVVGQAVKNLRYLDRTHIHEKLATTSKNDIATAVWRDGKRQRGRADMLKALAKAGSNMAKTVCVLQPSVRRSELESVGRRAIAKPADVHVRRLQQLDTLLLAARAECLGLGATFTVLGHEDGAPQAKGGRRRA